MDETENSSAEADEQPAFDLTSWLEAHRGAPVRLSAREDDGWVDREKFIERTESYTLDADPEEEVRYQLRVEDQREVVDTWVRYSFTETSKFVSGTPKDAIELVLEVQESVVDGAAPWSNADTVEFSTGVLGYGTDTDGFEPVTAKRVAGLEEQKQRLNRFLDTGRREWGLSEENGILLEGPPGTGKTELVMEVCQERYGSLPVMISGPEFLSKWVGESEKILREKFDEARDSRHKILYIDEIDAVTRERGELHEDYSARIVSQLLVLLDGVEAKQATEEEEEDDRTLKVIASTNLPHIVDEALLRPGRLGARPISFDRPNRIARKAILHHYLERIFTSERGQLGPRLEAFVTGERTDALDELVEQTEGFTGANLEDLIMESVSRLREEEKHRLDLETLHRVYEESFTPANEVVSIELADDDLTTGGPEIPLDASLVRLGPGDGTAEHAREVAQSYFAGVNAASDRSTKYTFRTIDPASMINRETAQTESNVIDAFDHDENERVCLYIEDTANLVRVKEYSQVIEEVIGLINEQLLQWNDENLLVIDPMSDAEQDEFTSFTPHEL